MPLCISWPLSTTRDKIWFPENLPLTFRNSKTPENDLKVVSRSDCLCRMNYPRLNPQHFSPSQPASLVFPKEWHFNLPMQETVGTFKENDDQVLFEWCITHCSFSVSNVVEKELAGLWGTVCNQWRTCVFYMLTFSIVKLSIFLAVGSPVQLMYLAYKRTYPSPFLLAESVSVK